MGSLTASSSRAYASPPQTRAPRPRPRASPPSAGGCSPGSSVGSPRSAPATDSTSRTIRAQSPRSSPSSPSPTRASVPSGGRRGGCGGSHRRRGGRAPAGPGGLLRHRRRLACALLGHRSDLALAELYRVIRPGGELRFSEHVVSERRSVPTSGESVGDLLTGPGVLAPVLFVASFVAASTATARSAARRRRRACLRSDRGVLVGLTAMTLAASAQFSWRGPPEVGA